MNVGDKLYVKKPRKLCGTIVHIDHTGQNPGAYDFCVYYLREVKPGETHKADRKWMLMHPTLPKKFSDQRIYYIDGSCIEEFYDVESCTPKNQSPPPVVSRSDMDDDKRKLGDFFKPPKYEPGPSGLLFP